MNEMISKTNLGRAEMDSVLIVLCDMYKQSINGKLPDVLTAYHITHADNIDAIRKDGLTSKSCRATTSGDCRRPAVYLLACKSDAYDCNVRNFLFDDNDNLVVLKITIPKKYYTNMREDGIFNISCVCTDGSAPFGIQYISDIPSTWIDLDK